MIFAMSSCVPFHPYMRKVIANVAGPQLLMPCFSYSGESNETWGGRGTAVGAGVGVATEVGVGGRGVNVANGVDGTGVGLGPTGSTTFFAYVLQTSYLQSRRLRTAGIW
jgi:hypothetical protein